MTLEKIASRLKLIESLVYRSKWALPPFRYRLFPQGDPGLPVDEIEVETSWEAVSAYQYWGQWNSEFVLVSKFSLPEDFRRCKGLALFLPLGESGDFSHPETLAYVDGKPFAACDRNHQELELPETWQDGEAHLLVLRGWAGLGGKVGAEPTQLFMRPCQLVLVDQPARDLVALVMVALGVVRNLSEDEPARAWLLNALDAAFKVLDTREPLEGNFYASIPAAKSVLDSGIKNAGPAKEVNIFATGHAHIDVAWLWSLAQSRQKAARTFQNALCLLERYPNFHFSQSQPQLYEFVRQDFPELFKQIQQKVAKGRWEVLGGMWLEADCNLSGAESLVRQFLLGRRYFSEYFGSGTETPVLWLPDAFGFCYNLPQLIQQAGLKYFFSIKLSWNQYNRMPYDSFWWQGLDGTRVLTHFSTTPSVGNEWKAATYNAEVEPGQVLATWKRFQQKELHPNLLMAYGFGDGGGGPTREMIENLQIMSDFPAAPKMRSSSVAEFFQALESEDGDQLPTWNGELYLELHRGTYTTQGRTKRANRKSEFALHDAEFLAATAAMLNPDIVYPRDELNRDWQLVCLNQFHDILPGSSIEQVYIDSQAQYQEVQQSARLLSTHALSEVAASLSGLPKSSDTSGLLLANPTSFKRDDLVFWPGTLENNRRFIRADGSCVYCQREENGVWLAPGPVAPYGFLGLKLESGTQEEPPFEEVKANCNFIENDFLRVEFNAVGDITRIYDKSNQREVLPSGCIANQFQAFEDRPIYWDAWDIERAYDDKMWLSDPALEIRLVEAGPLRACIEIKRRILHSDYIQQISLAFNSPRLDFSTTIQWHEKHILLKVAFPVDVLATQATYEIQWGNLQRPTHENTSWDWARFEVCAHKWADLSEGDYGVSLLNDCKFGHDIHDRLMRLSLLRSPTEPDAHADEGEHTFAYSLLPHAGGWDEHTTAAAYALNDPWLILPLNGQPIKSEFSLVSVDSPNVIIETVKQAEDGVGLIVRLYESQRWHRKVTLRAGFALARVWQTDLLENPQEELIPFGNQVQFDLRPYQIVTLRLQSGLQGRKAQ
jgi:alpha-mannosidase